MNYIMIPNQEAFNVVKFFADNQDKFKHASNLECSISPSRFKMIYDWKEDIYGQVDRVIQIELHKIKDVKYESYPVKPKLTRAERRLEMRNFVTNVISELKAQKID